MMDRRTARRYDLSLPVIVRVPVDKEATHQSGRTRDISTRGVYFTIDKDLIAGSELDLKLILPAEVTGDTDVFIQAKGKVIRVDKRLGDDNQKVAVAAAFQMIEIIRNEPATA